MTNASLTNEHNNPRHPDIIQANESLREVKVGGAGVREGGGGGGQGEGGEGGGHKRNRGPVSPVASWSIRCHS